jgi:hypothetical protein
MNEIEFINRDIPKDSPKNKILTYMAEKFLDELSNQTRGMNKHDIVDHVWHFCDCDNKILTTAYIAKVDRDIFSK